MRKTTIVKVPEWAPRDKGKLFLLTEWSAERAEKWAIKALLAFNRGGGQVPVQDVIGAGMEGIFYLGMQTFLRGQMQPGEVIPILDELLECVKFIRDKDKRDPAGNVVATDLVSADDVEDTQTRLWLRGEVVKLHTGFSPADAVSSLISLIMTAPAATSPNTETSRPSLDS